MSTQSNIEAELRAVANALPEERSADEAQLILEQVGDGLRANAVVPQVVSEWTQSLDSQVLEEVLGLSCTAISDLVLPGTDSDEELLAVAALYRDRMESLTVAVRHACFGSGRVAKLLPAFAHFEREVSMLDQALLERVSREAAERSLGERRALLAATSWCDALKEEDTSQVLENSVDMTSEAALSQEGRPTDECVTRYIQGGIGARWIEGFASRDSEFADELEECVEMLRDAGETVSLAARRWQKRFNRQGDADAVMLTLPLRLSAASEGDRVPILRRQLGVLHPTAAEAMLEIHSDKALLHVYGEPGSLSRVTFGEDSREVSEAAEEVVLEASVVSAPWKLAVESVDGARFSITLGIRGSEQE